MADFVSILHAEIERFLKIESLYGFFHQSSFLLINCVRSSGTSLYFSNAPSIKEGGGRFPSNVTTKRESTNHVIWLDVTGKGSRKSLMA